MGLLDKLFGRDTPSQEIVGKVDKEGPRNPIDQLGVTGRSQRNAAYEDTAHIPRITDYVAEKLSQLLRYSTEMPVLRLTEDDSPAQITDSKLGGAFYVPEGMKAPRNLDTGDPLYLLALQPTAAAARIPRPGTAAVLHRRRGHPVRSGLRQPAVATLVARALPPQRAGHRTACQPCRQTRLA